MASFPLYPLPLEPFERPLLWGGSALAERYGKRATRAATIGESWECWDGNRVAAGDARGQTLADLRRTLGSALTGTSDPALPFPLLTKFIDARAALSVQVHPDDRYARRVELAPFGKTECWLVLEADPGAAIVLGWKRDTSRDEVLERIREGTLEELLRYVDVRAGDVFHLPAGTVHAIGAGIVLFEVQQASDLTYRLYDYARRGPDGSLRDLHVEKAVDVLDFREATQATIAPLTFALHGLERTVLAADPYFTFERIEIAGDARGLDLEGSPLAVTALDRPVEVEARGARTRLEPFHTAVVPAGLETVMLAAEGGATVLAASPPPRPDSLAHTFSRAAVDIVASTAFFAQF